MKQQPQEITETLATLGITEAELQIVITNAMADGYFTGTDGHPRNTCGTRLWQEAVKGVRDTLKLKGWIQPSRSDDIYASIISPDNCYELVVWSGNKYTGIRAEKDKVQTKNGKGGGTSLRIQANLALPLNDSNISSIIKKQLIALIIYYDESLKEVRYEIAKPIGTQFRFSKDEPLKKPKVSKFEWRVIYPALSLSHINIAVESKNQKETKTNPIEFTDEINIDIDLKGKNV